MRPLFILLFSAFISCSQQQNEEPAATTDTNHVSSMPSMAVNQLADSAKHNFRFEITENENGFGYDIYDSTKMVIHQPIIPGLPGNEGFKTREQAAAVATLVKHKLDRNIMPPSVSPSEIDSVLKLVQPE